MNEMADRVPRARKRSRVRERQIRGCCRTARGGPHGIFCGNRPQETIPAASVPARQEPEPCLCGCAYASHARDGSCPRCDFRCAGYWPAGQDTRSRD